MAEANARMHLRDTVIDADVKLAIRMMLESFISAQKFAVMKKMQSTFKKHLQFDKDHFELLMFILKQLTMEQLTYLRCKQGPNVTTVEIIEKDLVERVKHIDNKISESISNFYKSEAFKSHGFSYDQSRKVIMQVLIST